MSLFSQMKKKKNLFTIVSLDLHIKIDKQVVICVLKTWEFEITNLNPCPILKMCLIDVLYSLKSKIRKTIAFLSIST